MKSFLLWFFLVLMAIKFLYRLTFLQKDVYPREMTISRGGELATVLLTMFLLICLAIAVSNT